MLSQRQDYKQLHGTTAFSLEAEILNSIFTSEILLNELNLQLAMTSVLAA